MRINISSVVVCDTEPIAMAGFRSLLESNGEFRVTAEETSLADAADAVRQLNPELLVVDKAFGIHRVMELVRVLRGSANRVRTVVWGINISEPEALRYLQTGAAGVVRKTAGLPALLQCLRTVATGATWMEESFLLEESPRATGRAALTSRELQVMDLVEKGMRNKDIAGILGISTGTVKIHLKHIFEKTGVRGRYGLALTGLREKGLLAAAAEPQ